MLYRSSRSLLRVLAVMSCILTVNVPAVSREAIPDKEALKARVNQLQAAIQGRSQEAILTFFLPELIQCEPDLEVGMFTLWGDENAPQLLSWKIGGIRYDGSSLGEELCPGRPLNARAGAIVEVVQKVQKPGQSVEKNEIELDWVYVDGMWYFLSVEC